MDDLFIVIPAYNESENIADCVDDWYPVIEKRVAEGNVNSKLVIINDGSKDDTFDILLNLAKTRPHLIALSKPNGGHGSTVLFGYRYAIKNGSNYIFQTDSDGQTDPNEFEAFWNKRHKYDAIIGNRVVRGDGSSRKFVENTVCLLLKLYFGIDVPDANAPFRLMKTETVEKYIDKMPENFNLPNIMFTTFFSYYKEKLNFITITFKPRKKGSNSINIKKIVKIGWTALGDFNSFKKDMRK